MAKHDSLTKLQIDEICSVYDECHNQIETAKKTRHSIATVSKYLIASGRGRGQGGLNLKITDAQILDGIEKGLTRQQIADRYGVHVEHLARRMKSLGVHAKYAPMATDHPLGNCWHYIKANDEKARNILPQFQYIESRKNRIRLRCRSCGDVIERDKSALRDGCTRCERCELKKRSKEQEEKELYSARISLVRTLQSMSELNVQKKCKVCGEIFYSQYNNAKYCSEKCRKQNINRKKAIRKRENGKSKENSIRHRCRKYGVYYDPSVKPKMIFERDHYQCKICGLFCIPGDTSWNGHFGPYSPTVDHIVALANGGTHTWDNVQCAHAICNSKKRDLITV